MKNAIRIVIALLACSLTAAATSIIPMSVEELSQAATHVVEGQALRSWSAWNEQHTLIYTYTSFAVGRTLKGTAPAEIVVKQPGGSAGGYTQTVWGVRHLQSGEHALLFLRPSMAADGTMVIVGLMQGQFQVFQAGSEAMASNGIVHNRKYDHGMIEKAGTSPRLSDIEDTVRRAIE
ncbi:MAG: hypothetical protein ACRD3E_02120 [Terriglobales bacterium]